MSGAVKNGESGAVKSGASGAVKNGESGAVKSGASGAVKSGAGEPILSLRNVSKRFAKPLDLAGRIANVFGAKNRDVTVHAVDGVDLAIQPGEVVGLVGESGCGKSTLGRIVAGIHAASTGEMLWRGKPVTGFTAAERKAETLAVQMIFQDPMSSLNPRLRVDQIVGEAPVVHGLIRRAERDDYVAEVLARVGLDASYLKRYPHQFSGGQRARIGIARALAVNPEFLVCDESVAALDVSIQAQVLNLFMHLRDEMGLTYLFISHDLSVVRHLSDRVVIMYLGRVVEIAPVGDLFAGAQHPYTQALLANVPKFSARKTHFTPLSGEIPSPLAPPPGCHFHPRCPQAGPRCRAERPELREAAPGRFVACHLHDGGVGTLRSSRNNRTETL